MEARRMDSVPATNQALGRALLFAASFNPHSGISFITPVVQVRSWRPREEGSFFPQTVGD